MVSSINKYNPEDFTHSHYRKLLRISKKKFVPRSFTNFNKNENFIIWRHDIDASVIHAKDIAEIEFSEKISATYFILLTGQWYNLLEKRESDAVKDIINLGHEIGLHFDASYYDIKNERELVKRLDAEKKFLESIFKIRVKVFAFHNTNEDILKFNKWKYSGMINTYAEYFRKNAGYCSDSNGTWRYKRMEDFLQEKGLRNAQVLTHPVFWQNKSAYPKQKIWGSLLIKTDEKLKWYDNLLKIDRRDNIAEFGHIFGYLTGIDKETGIDIEKKWICGEFQTAYLLLWKFQQKIVNEFLRKYIELELLKSRRNVEYFYNNAIKLDLYKRFELVTGLSFVRTFGIKYSEYKTLISIKESILNASNKYSTAAVKKGFVSLANFLIKLETIIRN